MRSLRTGADGPILVVHDARREALDPLLLAGTGAQVVQRVSPVCRGDLSMLDPYFAGAAMLLDQSPPFDWLVYLSGQDYPVRPLVEVESGLAGSGADGFLTHWEVTSPESPWPQRRARRRYFYRYARLPDRLAPWLRLLRPVEAVTPLQLYLTYGALVGWPARRHPFVEGFRCHGCWMWHSLSRPCVDHLLATLKARPELAAYYRRTVVPDESLVGTVLANAGRFRLVNDNRRFADSHERPGGHARVLDERDLPALTSGRYDFARKVELERSASLLDALDARLGQTGKRTG